METVELNSTVCGLKPDQEVSCRIRAVNEVGMSDNALVGPVITPSAGKILHFTENEI